MPEILPFKGIIYNKDKVGDISKVVAPPYDVISPSQQDFYYKLHPYNIIRIILGKEEPGDNLEKNKYIRAKEFFREWLSQGVLIKEKIPSIYVYYQKYTVEGEVFERKGFISLMRLEDFSSGSVFPHEEVFPEPQMDRLRLLRSCNANFSAIFSLFSDPERKIDSLCKEEETIFEFEDFDGINHRLSAIRDSGLIKEICSLMREKRIFIADGHHRYLTCLRFREEMKKRTGFPAGIDYTMVYFLNMDSGSVTILPVHRLIGGLEQDELEKIARGMEEFFQGKPFGRFEEKEDGTYRSFLSMIKNSNIPGMYTRKGGYFLLLPKRDELFSGKIKSAVLDNILKKIIKRKINIHFTTSSFEAVEKVNKGEFQIAFFLPPTKVEEVKNVALAGKKMPPKSTYFYPKLLSGLLIRDLEDAVKSGI